MNTRDAVPIQDITGKQTCTSIDHVKAEQWVYVKNGEVQLPQDFLFTTPNEAASEQRCGKVMFSDMHASTGPVTVGGIIPPYPTSCGTTTTLTPQEQALAFMLFDISSCAGLHF